MCLLPSSGSYNGMQILLGSNGDVWHNKVMEPCVDIVKRFLSGNATSTGANSSSVSGSPEISSKELWIQYICQVCNYLNAFTRK
jgi:hypothetical protein